MVDKSHPMNDQAIDRALREALDVSPSPDFVARVRTRIANEPPPRSLWGRWTVWTQLAAGALVAAAVVIAVVVGGRKQHGDTTTQLRRDATAADVRLSAPSVRETASSRASGFPSRTLRAGSQTRIGATKTPATEGGRRDILREPEVLIAQDEAAALRQLLARAGEGRIVGASPATDASGATVDLMPPEIMIPPIKIDPLMAVNGEEGVRQ
jgi:hypothetical protein